uniref:Uncharacterized protein n=1 Tax=Enterobacter sp. HP19 TaxID=1811975 RepID=A0A2H4UEF1_9ENTR|nr:hypothetical protein [Enterobacter sp. HP19]
MPVDKSLSINASIASVAFVPVHLMPCAFDSLHQHFFKNEGINFP